MRKYERNFYAIIPNHNSITSTENFIINIESLNDETFRKYDVTVSMLRLDSIHPIVSGNKYFKLHFFLREALYSSHKKIITFGGPYSNHLAATAFACREQGIKCIGIVRGEIPPQLSHTLLFCMENGMKLEYLTRPLYKNVNTAQFHDNLRKNYGDHTLIPEGGYSPEGVKGAKLIAGYFNNKDFTHICCAIGTATTFAGLILACGGEAKLTGFSVLKNLNDIDTRLEKLTGKATTKYSCIGDYHFGGYAKKTPELIAFINNFYKDNKIPLDFVYTGKMMYGVYDLIRENYFEPGSKILCIHTGGLQGNKSLPGGTLCF